MAHQLRTCRVYRFSQGLTALALLGLFLAGTAMAAESVNRLSSVNLDDQANVPTVLIKTEQPVGYRYTVYDSADPVRVVVDFPSMEIDGLPEVNPVDAGVIRELRVSRFELASGNLARIEVLLAKNTEYQVSLEDNEFRISFAAEGADPVADISVAVNPQEQIPAREMLPADPTVPASTLKALMVSSGQVEVAANGRLGEYRQFTLANPPRLVVDILGVSPEFKSRSFEADMGISQVRVGTDKGKTRLVFDGNGSLPDYVVENQGTSLRVRWGDVLKQGSSATPGAQSAAEPAKTAAAEPVQTAAAEPVVSPQITATAEAGSSARSEQSAPPAAVAPQPEPVEQKKEIRVEVVPEEAPSEAQVASAPSQSGQQTETVGVQAERSEDSGQPMGLADRMAVEASKYTGEKISLVFDNADVRSILQLIGDVSGYNILASNDVGGNITLRLIDVPWDMALELVLETAGLDKIQDGNVVRILPAGKIREMEQAARAAQMEELEVGPLTTKVIDVNYMEVGQVQGFLKDFLSARGSIVPDSHNKQIIVKDVASVIDQIEEMIKIVDKPVRQVLIEARIVEATTTFSRDIGVKWNVSYNNDGVGGLTDINTATIGMGGAFLINSAANPASAGFSTGISFGGIDDSVNIDLRLSALETSGDGKIISTPRVTTLNGEKAKISQGTSIPFSSTGNDGSTDVKFEKADLSLEVTPEINPDGSILLDIKASNSAVGSVVPTATGSAVSIDTKEAQTKVMVRNGQTTVIGGIFVESEQSGVSGVPLLMSVPILGHLFKSTNSTRERRELLIFITPRILES